MLICKIRIMITNDLKKKQNKMLRCPRSEPTEIVEIGLCLLLILVHCELDGAQERGALNASMTNSRIHRQCFHLLFRLKCCVLDREAEGP